MRQGSGERVDLRHRHAQRLAHLADQRAAPEMHVGGDQRHVLVPVGVEHVIQHFVAPVPGEVDVDVRVVRPLQAEEALEVQVVAEGVDLGDVEGAADQAVGGGAPPHRRNAARRRLAHDVPHDQKIRLQLQPVDHCQLVFQADLRGVPCGTGILPAHTFMRQPPQEGGGGFVRRQVEGGQFGPPQLQRDVASLGDAESIVDRFGNIIKQARHFGGRFQPGVRRGRRSQRQGVNGGVGADGGEQAVHLPVLRPNEKHPVGRDHRQAAFLGEGEQTPVPPA